MDQIVMSEEMQMRAAIDVSALADYVEACRAKEHLPPVLLYQVPARGLVLVDGYHRVGAFAQAGLAWVPAEIRDGTWEQALDAALLANSRHGVRRTPADKRRAVMAALGMAKYADASDRAVAKATATSGPFVAVVRAELALAQAAARARTAQEVADDFDPWEEAYPEQAGATAKPGGEKRARKSRLETAGRWLARARQVADANGALRVVEAIDVAAAALDAALKSG